MHPVEVVALTFLGCFVIVQPWLPFARPGGARRYSLLPDDDAREALDRAVRWDATTAGQRTALEVAAGLVGVLALLAGLVAGAAWLAAVAGCLATVWLSARLRVRGRDTVLAAARERGTTPSPRSRSATRRRRQRVLAATLVASLLGALVAYPSQGLAWLSGSFVSGVLIIVATLALIGLVASADRVFGDEEPD